MFVCVFVCLFVCLLGDSRLDKVHVNFINNNENVYMTSRRSTSTKVADPKTGNGECRERATADNGSGAAKNSVTLILGRSYMAAGIGQVI